MIRLETDLRSNPKLLKCIVKYALKKEVFNVEIINCVHIKKEGCIVLNLIVDNKKTKVRISL